MASNVDSCAFGRRFTMDLNYLDTVWATGTKITVRAGDCQPVTVLNSQSRLLAHEKKDKIG